MRFRTLIDEPLSFEASKRLFASLLHSEDPVVLAAFLDLDNTPDGIPGVPSRSGYLIGLCAVEAWCAANPRRPLGDVLQLEASEAWKLLQ